MQVIVNGPVLADSDDIVGGRKQLFPSRFSDAGILS